MSSDVEEGDFGPQIDVKVPSTFNGWMALIGKTLAPAEELSPFKLGQISQLIQDVHKDTGLMLAPYFTMGQVAFLIAFVLYLTTAIVAIVLDFGAASDGCADEHWVWLFVLLSTAIPTGLGFVMGLVKTGLNILDLKKRIGWEVPAICLSFPAPVLSVVLGILGIVLWANMDSGCDGTYSSTYGLLYTVFKVQVLVMGISAIFGTLTCIAQGSIFLASLNPSDPDLDQLKADLKQAESNRDAARGAYEKGAEQIVSRLKKELAAAEKERDTLKKKVKPDPEDPDAVKLPASFSEFSEMAVKTLAPMEEISPFKLGQIQILISDIHAGAGEAVAPYFALGMVFFLMSFAAYFVLAIISLAADFAAMDCPCATESAVWLYVLLVVVIPTSLGFVLGLIRAALALADLKGRFGWEVPSVFLTLPGPLLYIGLGIWGWFLWLQMSGDCAASYQSDHGLLLTIFHLQVVIMTVAAVFGIITCVAQASVLISELTGKKAEDKE